MIEQLYVDLDLRPDLEIIANLVKPGERVLLNLGRLSREKNIEQVLRVFPKLHEAHPDVRFVIVGEGPMREPLLKMAAELGVADSVTFTGPKPWEQIDRY